jgi:PKD repeat protein
MLTDLEVTYGNGQTQHSAEAAVGRARASATSPVIDTKLPALATVGQQFAYVIHASGFLFEFGASPLPSGFAFDSTHGVITGTPTTAGVYSVHVTATDGNGTGSSDLTIVVLPALSPTGPVITTGTSATGRINTLFEFRVRARDITSGARFAAAWLPPGLSIDPTTGRISGTPTSSGSYEVLVSVTEAGARAYGSLELIFDSGESAPLITSGSEATLLKGEPFSYTIATTGDRPGGPVSYGIAGDLPQGLNFDRTAGKISGTYDPGHFSPGAQLGHVQLFAYNALGTATLPLTFLAPPHTAAANIATRAVVGTGDNVLIGGFIITGSGPKRVIIRAIGPSSGVGGALQDPTLELHSATGALLQANDDWQSNQEQEIKDTTIPPGNQRESAIIATLLPGQYTAIVGSKGGATGPALVEVYDLDGPANSQLAQISTRGNVRKNDDILIGGFIIAGPAPVNVLVRGIGPELTQANVPNALQDPTLELHDGNGGVLAFNDNWESDQEQAITDTGVPPRDPREPAILRSLPPGNYTAIVRGKGSDIGVALVEVYILK